MTASQFIAPIVGVSERQAHNTITLFDEGATVPFIARYRKEMTGQLDEVQINAIKEQYQKFQEVLKRREAILKSIEEQGNSRPNCANVSKKPTFCKRWRIFICLTNKSVKPGLRWPLKKALNPWHR